jgi:hypothetical protein
VLSFTVKGGIEMKETRPEAKKKGYEHPELTKEGQLKDITGQTTLKG